MQLRRILLACLCFALPVTSCSLFREFEVSYSGMFEGELAGNARIEPCYQVFDYPARSAIWLSDKETPSYLILSFPITMSRGTYQFSNDLSTLSRLPQISGLIYPTASVHYSLISDFVLVFGYVTIKNFPEKPGQRVRGEFEATLHANDDPSQVLSLQGNFDFEADSDPPYDCLHN